MNKPGGAPAKVRVTRRGDSITVDPWRLKLEKGQEVEWILDESDDEMAITEKPNQRRWPFVDRPPQGGKNRPARSGRMRQDAEEGTYRYNIELSSGGDRLVIDPEMILPRFG